MRRKPRTEKKIFVFNNFKLLVYGTKDAVMKLALSLSPKFVVRSLNVSHRETHVILTVNPLLSTPGVLFFSSTFEGGGGA